MSIAAFGVSVTVSSPSANYDGNSPVKVSANASSSRQISGWVVYVDSQVAYQVGWQSSIDTNINMGKGSHRVVVRAWDSSGAYGDQTVQVTIGNNGNGLPTPPYNAAFVNKIENRGGWNWCHNTGCAGGSGKGTYWMAQNQGSPSQTGSSMELFNSGVWANALWWNKFGADDSAHNFLWDFWVYFDDNYLHAAQSTEFDVFQFVSGYNYMMGTQCDAAAGTWDTWDAKSGHWIHSSVKCPRFSPNTWHHVQLWTTTDTNAKKYTYHVLVVDGQSYGINITGNAGYTGWNHNVGTQWQLDVNATGAGYHEWVDNAKLWYW
jgi:hypothetical protein